MQKKFLKVFVCAALIVCSLSVSAFGVEDCAHAGGWVEGQCAECGFFCTHEWVSGRCSVCSKTCYHDNMSGSVCSDCGFVCDHVWQLGACVTCHAPCPQGAWRVAEGSPTSRVCGLCGNYQSYCEGCFGSFVNGYCPTCDPEPPVSADRIGVSLRDTVTPDMASGALAEVIALLPTLLFAVAGFIGIRKGLGFLLGRIRSA